MAVTNNTATPPPTGTEGHFDMTELAMTVGRLEERISGIPGAGTTYLSSAGGALTVAALVLGIAMVFIPREFDAVSRDIKAVEEALKSSTADQGEKIDNILATVTNTARTLSSVPGRLQTLEMANAADDVNDQALTADIVRLNAFLEKNPNAKSFFTLAGSGADPADVIAAYKALSDLEKEQAATASMILGASLMRPYEIMRIDAK